MVWGCKLKWGHRVGFFEKVTFEGDEGGSLQWILEGRASQGEEQPVQRPEVSEERAKKG